MAEVSKRIAVLKVNAQKKNLPAITSFIREISKQQGFKKSDVNKLELITEEACLNVIEHAFENNEDEYLDVILERKPTKFVIAIEDQGLPWDMKHMGKTGKTGIGILLMKAFADEMRSYNLGRKGKRLEFVKNVPYDSIDIAKDEQISKQTETELAPLDTPLEIRLMNLDEGIALARCMYRSYSFSYKESVYLPDKVKDLLENGLQVSIVAVTEDNEIIGHIAMMKEARDSVVGDVGQAVVDPRFRKRNLFKRMKQSLIEYAKEQGMYGLFSEAVSVHSFTQKGNIALGAVETGLMLANVPQRFSFKKIHSHLEKRQTTVIYYIRVKKEPLRTVYPPMHHWSIINEIYEYGKFNRKIEKITDFKSIEIPESSVVEIQASPDVSIAMISVKKFGKDIESIIKHHLHDLCLNKIECIYLDLPLSEPAVAVYCAALEVFGFFFACVIPELQNGDVLRLQYLNNVQIDPSTAVIVSDFAKKMYNYILTEGQSLL